MEYSLYVDESGESVPFRYRFSPYFILSGCIIESRNIRDIIENLNHIKYKYWNRADIVFRSANIGKKDKDFSIFDGDIKKFNGFMNDLESFFKECPMSLISVVVDQQPAHLANWVQRTVLRRGYRHLFANYIRFLLAKRSKGQIIQEASTAAQDMVAYEEFYRYQSFGIPSDGVSPSNVKEHVTGLSFFTKKSNDSLSQIADLLGYGIKTEAFISQRGKKVGALNSYQKMVRNAARSKLLHISPNTGAEKSRLYKNLESLKYIP